MYRYIYIGVGETVEVAGVERQPVVRETRREPTAHVETFHSLSPEKWLKPRPESGLDCLNCADALDSLPVEPARDQIAFVNPPDLYWSSPESGSLQCEPGVSKMTI